MLFLPAALALLANAAQAQTPAAASPPQQRLFDGPYFSSAFSGLYAGAKAGINISNASGAMHVPSRTRVFPGATLGFGIDVGRVLLGGEAFADFHHGSTTRKDAGFDAKLGVPMRRYMPYLRVGVVSEWPSTDLHWGMGVEYRALDQLGVAAEWTTDTSRVNRIKRRNDSFTLGIHYYF